MVNINIEEDSLKEARWSIIIKLSREVVEEILNTDNRMRNRRPLKIKLNKIIVVILCLL